jgi:hypothetical protein
MLVATSANTYLTSEQREHFLEHGWVHVPKAIPPENISRFTADVWIRLGYDKDDPSTWEEERFGMPRQKEMLWRDFAPKAWGAICEHVRSREFVRERDSERVP